MKYLQRVLILIVTVALLSACQSLSLGEHYFDYVQSVPPIEDGSSRLFVLYPTQGADRILQIYVDEERVSRVLPGGFVHLDVDAGDHQLIAVLGTLSRGCEVAHELEDGKRYFYEAVWQPDAAAKSLDGVGRAAGKFAILPTPLSIPALIVAAAVQPVITSCGNYFSFERLAEKVALERLIRLRIVE